MKNVYIFLIIICSAITGCQKESQKEYDLEITTGKILDGKKIEITYVETHKNNHYSIGTGDRTVFEYKHIKAQSDAIFDDEYSQGLAFEINLNEIHTGSNHFRYENEALETIKAYYNQEGAWTRGGTYKVKNGIIEGTKLSDNKWKVKVSVVTTPLYLDEEPKAFAFDQIFEK